jgi:hypothetical protein
VAGGRAFNSADSNIVEISGGTVSGNIYGGFTLSTTAKNNIVTISGNLTLFAANLCGGDRNVGSGDIYTGNTLNVWN